MEAVCESCGLPKNICVCGQIAKEQQKIRIRTMQRRFRKMVTVLSGFDDEKTAKELGKTMKRALACGGTVRGTEIELQGDHKKRAREVLLREGYQEGLIDD